MVSKKDKYLAAAQKFLERGQLDKALAEFAKVVQEDPKDTRTWLKMAELHAKRGAADQATEIYLKTGELYTEQGFFQKAVAVYKNVLKLSPSYVQGHIKLAEVYKRLGLMSDAIQQYELAAFAYQKIGKSAEALAALREIVEVNPENVISRIKLAESASQAGATDEAIREFSLAADQLKAQGRSDEYVRVAERLLFHQPDNLPVARELAEVYILKNNPRLALAKLQACLKADPRDPENVSLLAQAFEQLDVPKAVSVWRELAQIHHESGRSGDRDVAIRKALLLDPGDRESQEAARRYGVSVGVSQVTPPPPLPPGAASLRPLTPSGSGLYAAAGLPHTQTGLRRQPAASDGAGARRAAGVASMPDLSRIMAEADVFVKYGLLDRAVDHLRRVFEIQPEYLPAREKLAAVLTQLGRRAEAAAELEFMAEHLARSDRPQALKLAERARVLDPGAQRAAALLEGSDLAFETTGARSLDPLRPPPRLPPLQRPPERSARMVTPPPFDDIAPPDDPTDDLPLEELSIDDIEVDLESEEQLAAGDLLTPPPELAARIASNVRAQAALHAAGAASGAVAGEIGDDASSGFGAPPSTSSATPAPAPHLLDPDLEADLEQVDFFADQALLDEAQGILQDLRDRYPGHPLVDAKSAELARRFPAAAAPAPPARDEPLGAVPRDPPERLGQRSGGGSAPVAVVTSGGKADLETHADLGIAYKEMGLYDAAIVEFKLLTQDSRREVFALTMIGECCEAKGSLTDAIIRYKEALNCPQISPEETIQLYFCLGSTFERLNDRSEALYFYEKVAKRDPKFRDVGDKISSLKPQSARPL